MKLKAIIHGMSKKTRIIIYLSSILILCIINPCSALAWSAGGLKSTIASIIVSMLMSSGAGVTNMDWLSQLNTAYGVESSIGTLENAISQGLLTESAGTLIDTGLSDAIMANSAYTDLGLDALFSTTADDALIQAGTVAASGGANIAAESIGAVTLGTVGQAFIAVGAGIGLGVLAHHVIERFGQVISQGDYITETDVVADYVSPGQGYVFGTRTYSHTTFNTLLSGNNLYPFNYPNGNFITFGVMGLDSTTYNRFQFSNGNLQSETNNTSIGKGGLVQDSVNASHVPAYATGHKFASYSDFSSARNAFLNDNTPMPALFSPDVITADGNAIGQYDNGYQVPAITPYYNPQNQGLRPIDMDDYLDYARSANDLTDEDKTGADQADNFKDFIDPYLENQEPVVPEPDPDYTDPGTIPEQPDYTDKEPVSAEDVQEADAYTAPNLMDRFPFCIPNDILAIFRKFKVGRQAPYIEWNFKYDAIGLDYTFELDLSMYDDVAQILRLMELIGFVVGLGVATRKLIGA